MLFNPDMASGLPCLPRNVLEGVALLVSGPCKHSHTIIMSNMSLMRASQGGPNGLPLYAEEWVEELLSRVFDILTNLEAPETRSDHSAVQGNSTAAASDQASFLIEGSSMFR